MSPELALLLVNRMAAAFPSPKWGDDTIEFYADELQAYEFESAERAVQQITRTHMARPSVAALRAEIGKRMPERVALTGPGDPDRLDLEDPLPTASFALSRRLHPGQGETPTTVVRTTAEERRLLEKVYAEQRDRYRLWLESHTPEERAQLQRQAYNRWRDGKQAARR